MKTIAQYMPEITKDTIANGVAAAEAEVQKARANYESWMARYEYAAEDRASIEAGTACRCSSYTHVANFKRVRDAESHLRHVKDVAKLTALRSAFIRLSVLDCYAIKESLKCNGYKWSSFDKSWSKDVKLEDVKAEVALIVSLGAPAPAKLDVYGSLESVMRDFTNYLSN